MGKAKSKKTFSIKRKLIAVAFLFLASIVVTELFAIRTDSHVASAVDEMRLRQNQLSLLNKVEVGLVELTLAAMDAIVDKGSGEIGPELQEEMTTANNFLTENLPRLEELADTAAEKRLAQTSNNLYPKLGKAIMTDLPKLITNHAEEAAFADMDNLVDGLSRQIDESVRAMIASVEEENNEAVEAMYSKMSTAKVTRRIFAAIILGLIGLTLLFIGRSILTPILAACRMIQDVAEGEGDLTKRLEAGGDEIGELSNWFNVFIQKLHGIIGQVQTNLTTLDSAASNLSILSESLASGAENATNRSNTVATAAEEMSTNMSAVAAASEQASINVNMVASATEEMNATVNEIAGNTAKAKQVTEEAVAKTDIASKRVDELGEAANEISRVTEVITEISEQTNLLALNATIEAARAGEAGKGFAVVANEIKELAKQTAEATLEIRQKIEAIQDSTNLTIAEINEINTIINAVNEIVSTIAAAVEEQSASTNEISSNVSQAAQGITQVNENVSQSSAVAGDISQEISGVSYVAGELKSSSASVNQQSEDLSALAGQLTEIVNQFKLK